MRKICGQDITDHLAELYAICEILTFSPGPLHPALVRSNPVNEPQTAPSSRTERLVTEHMPGIEVSGHVSEYTIIHCFS